MKPEIKYDDTIFAPRLGVSAIIRIVSEHPRLGLAAQYAGIVTTSTVMAVHDNGDFETRNSIYRKV